MLKIWSGLIFVLKIAGVTVRFVASSGLIRNPSEHEQGEGRRVPKVRGPGWVPKRIAPAEQANKKSAKQLCLVHHTTKYLVNRDSTV